MGTAVQYPHDCLRPQRRLKNQTSGMVYPLESAPRSKRNRPASSQSLEAGLLPLPGHSQHSLPMGIPRRGNDAKHPRARGASYTNQSKSPPMVAPDISVYRILQRPKQNDPAAELLAHFVALDKSALLKEARRPQIEDSDGVYICEDSAAHKEALGMEVDSFKMKHRGLQRRPVRLADAGGYSRQGAILNRKDLDRSADGLQVSSAVGCKHTIVKVAESKQNAVKEKLPSSLEVKLVRPRPSPSPVMVAAKPIRAKEAARHDITSKPVNRQHGEGQDNSLPKSSVRLQRSTTEPPMAKHIMDQYTRTVMHVSFSNPKLETHTYSHQICENGMDLSCEERWAGPAYSSSPPPDSLPLPKLCLPHAKYTSLEVRPLVKQYSTSVYMQPFLEPTAAPPVFVASEAGGEWDAVFATRSLRRLLNLDPC